jgi:hypothetical protein
MALAVTKFTAYGLEIPDAVRVRHVQRVSMTFTAANTDATWDLGTTAGTFWTSAEAHATYGSIATEAKRVLLLVGANCKVLSSVGGTINLNYIQAAALGGVTTNFTLASTNGCPDMTFVSGSAPTAGVLIIEWCLNDGFTAIHSDFGA